MRKPTLPGLAILLAIIAVSTASILIRLSNAPALVIAFYRMSLATLIIMPFAIQHNKEKSELSALSWKDLLILGGVGVLLAVHFSTWIQSLKMTTVASSVILVSIHPFIVGLLAHRFLSERLTSRLVMGIILGFIGMVVMAWGDLAGGTDALVGDILAFIGGVAVSGYILVGRIYRQRISVRTYAVLVYGACAATLLAFSLLAGQSLFPYSGSEYLLFMALALIPTIFGHTVYNWALKHVRAQTVSVSLLGEPLGATILAWLIFLETPAPIALAGGLLVLAGIYMAATGSRKKERTQQPTYSS